MSTKKQISSESKKFPLATTLSIVAVFISLLGVVYQSQQNELVIKQSETGIHGMLIERNARLLELQIENPEIRQYFYDGVVLTEDKLERGKALTMAEMWTDFFEQVLIQLENLPPEMEATWKVYASDMYQSSTAIQTYFSESCSWYHESLVSLWGCEKPEPAIDQP